MANERQHGELYRILEDFAAGYHAAEWTPSNSSAYQMRLQFFEIRDIKAGLAKASAEAAASGSRWIPDVETCAKHIGQAERDRKRFDLQRKLESTMDEPFTANADVPVDPDASAAYIAAAEDAFEQFARQCEVESKAMGLDPSKPSPAEVINRRLHDIRSLLGDAFGVEETDFDL